MEANVESLKNLKSNLKDQGYDLPRIPYVLQLNKRDMATAVPVEEMKRQLLMKDEPVFEAVAQNGTGVFDTLKAIARMVLGELRKTA
jgi:signal recognition particle receptor subunit beta